MKFEHLFSPMQVGKVTYRNRIVSAPMAFGLIVQNPDARDFTYRKLEASAKGGNGCVIVGETDVNFTDAVRIPASVPLTSPSPRRIPRPSTPWASMPAASSATALSLWPSWFTAARRRCPSAPGRRPSAPSRPPIWPA